MASAWEPEKGKGGGFSDLVESIVEERLDLFRLIRGELELLGKTRADEVAETVIWRVSIVFGKREGERPLSLQLDLGQAFLLFGLDDRLLGRRDFTEDFVAGGPEFGAVFDGCAGLLDFLGAEFFLFGSLFVLRFRD